MLKGQTIGMQRMACLRAGSTVKIIIDQRMADGGKVHAYLVRASGKKTNLEQRAAAVGCQNLVGCFGVFAARIINAAFDDTALLAGDRRFDNTFAVFKASAGQRQIFLFNLLLAQPVLNNRLLGKITRPEVLRSKRDTGCIPASMPLAS